MAGRRICAGDYQRYNGKVIYVVSAAEDADAGEEMVIWRPYAFSNMPKYHTVSEKSFCVFSA